ncbi:hypothetical protein Lalb_Chr17g0337791 [Lupinus albus]|uniref:Uncharacterized protein n=1 Tax=Lupinus albus TaxID=3870 RepID=A0A6A4P4Y6_LUPAL|nr:hypothetical protein Lalb_Chr17g0337791 [Lupinus albus]
MIFVFVELLQHQLDLNSELRLQEKSTSMIVTSRCRCYCLQGDHGYIIEISIPLLEV